MARPTKVGSARRKAPTRSLTAQLGRRRRRSARLEAYAVDTVSPSTDKLAELYPELVHLVTLELAGRKRAMFRSIISEDNDDPRFRWAEIEAAIGLAGPDRGFRAAIADAVSDCASLRLLRDYKEMFEEFKAALAEIAARAETALAATEQLNAAIARLPGAGDCGEAPFSATIEDLRACARFARRQAAPPRVRTRYYEVQSLVLWLAKAFEQATGRRASVYWNPMKAAYDGDFLALVEAVLPRLSALSDQIKRRLAQPNSPEALGKFVVRALKKDKKPASDQ